MTQEAHSTEDKDKPISTPEEFINYVEGLFEI
jgi:hypothetical protein